MTALLEVDRISKSFSGLKAMQDVSFAVPEGTIVGLIGPNGAGKTTCFNVVAGVYRADAGEVRFAGKRIDGWRADQICRARRRAHVPAGEAVRRAHRDGERRRRRFERRPGVREATGEGGAR